MTVRSQGKSFGGSGMARRRDEEKKQQQPEAQESILVAQAVTALNTATGEVDSVWVWELED